MNKLIHTATIIVFVALGISANVAEAVRVFPEEEQTYELEMGEVRLPGNEAGTFTFKRCSDCKTQSMRVTGSTVYAVNGRKVAFPDFTKTAEDFRKRQGGVRNTLVLASFNMKSNRITRLSISYSD